MHLLGIAGMPRRIPDFPDAFASINDLMTLGSSITALSLVYLLFILRSTLRFVPMLDWSADRLAGRSVGRPRLWIGRPAEWLADG
jgi:heme/copper-type cytochrome/quinol oxidase subunit 1